MSKLAEELTAFFSKVTPVAPTNNIIIKETERGASLQQFTLYSSGILEQIPSEFSKGLWRDIHNYDYECDGIILVSSPDASIPQLLLVELKSELKKKQFIKALKQIVISLLKIHCHFSMCDSFKGLPSPVKVLICCSNISNWLKLLENQSTVGSLEPKKERSKENKMFRALLTNSQGQSFYLSEVLNKINDTHEWHLPCNLLKVQLDIQILCSDGDASLEHSL
jgi:hypothetical protein